MKKNKSSLKYLFELIKPYKIGFIFGVVLVVCEAILVIIAPKIFGVATNIVVSGFKLSHLNQIVIDINFNSLYKILLILFLIYLSITVITYIRQVIIRVMVGKIGYDIRKQIDQKINSLSIATLDKQKDGDIISLVVNDTGVILDSLPELLSQSFYSIIVVVGILVMMFSISWQMTLVALLSVPFIMIVGVVIMSGARKYFKTTQDEIAKINSHVDEMYSNHLVIQSYNGQKDAISKFEKLNNSLVNSALKSQFFSGLIFPITAFINNIAYVIIIIFGATKVLDGSINIGNLQAFIQYNQQFTNPLQQIAQLSTNLQLVSAASMRIVNFLKLEEMETEEDKLELKEVKGDIRFENVCFSYVEGKQIIKNFSLDVKQGDRVAIVGSTGAGKTTLINLLMRFYELDSGRILLDGVDISQLKRSEIAKNFSMVLQDAWLFNGSIYENIAYGNEFNSEQEVEMAAKLANADHFISTLNHGYKMIINEDSSNISQGQKQLLTIARAFLGNKKVLILDEATSSVDTRTEKLIQEAMEKLMYNKTCFIIAHRLSTIKNADVILYMEDGNIKEMGKHQELLNLNGSYAKLYYSQFEN